ncbi:MAG: alpha/beta fold hydrolase [Thermodesulfobacteriota bacterium]
MPRVNIDSIELQYEISGYGPPVVFINGLTMDLNGWLLQVEPFSRKYRMLRYDCRGQGGSDKPETEYSQELHADDLRMLMEKLDIPKAHIIGLSNGGMIAQHFALRHPEKTGALVLVDTCSYVDTLLGLIITSWIKSAEAGGSGLRYDVALPYLFSEEFTKQNLDRMMAMKEFNLALNPVKPVVNLSKASRNHDLRDRVSEIKAPTLIIAGEEDILIPVKYSRILREKIKNSTLVTIKHCGHVPPIEKPDEFNEIVMRFLGDHDNLLI